jgi:SHS2 domain-containing protein
MSTGHEFLPVTGDIQVHAWAPTLAELFRETGLVLMRIIVPGPASTNEEISVRVDKDAEDLKALLFDWLSEILYLFDADLLVINEIEIDSLDEVEDGRWEIKSQFKGERFRKGYHRGGKEVKAVTYSYMTIEERDDGLQHLLIIFDI